MKWFKHDTDAHRSEGLTALQAKLGLGALGRWWVLLEIIAEKMDSSDKCSVEYPVRWWCEKLQYSPRELWNFLKTCEQHCKILVETSPELDSNFARTSPELRPNLTRTESKLDSNLTRTESKLQSNSIVLKHELVRVHTPNLLKKRDEYNEKSRQTPPKNKDIREKNKETREKSKERENEAATPPAVSQELVQAIETWNATKAQSWPGIRKVTSPLPHRFSVSFREPEFNLEEIVKRASDSNFLSDKRFISLLWLVTKSEKTGNFNWEDILAGRYDNQKHNTGNPSQRAGNLTPSRIDF